jgi:hypothetical protein
MWYKVWTQYALAICVSYSNSPPHHRRPKQSAIRSSHNRKGAIQYDGHRMQFVRSEVYFDDFDLKVWQQVSAEFAAHHPKFFS